MCLIFVNDHRELSKHVQHIKQFVGTSYVRNVNFDALEERKTQVPLYLPRVAPTNHMDVGLVFQQIVEKFAHS